MGDAGYFPAHFPLRHLPALPQSESNEQDPPGELAHFPLRHFAPPQSESNEQEPPAAVAHFPLRHLTPFPQSESKLHRPASAKRREGIPSSRAESKKPANLFMTTPFRFMAGLGFGFPLGLSVNLQRRQPRLSRNACGRCGPNTVCGVEWISA